ncbi:uncharacterized protein [Dendropsophus ebraccatus]|uniref:uncharacterized protein n=1 Tax=Dendropsophus ebraccatus TaxID=150705 RepID=UPI0038318B68
MSYNNRIGDVVHGSEESVNSLSWIRAGWDASDTSLLLIAIIFFGLNITCLFIIYVKLKRRIDGHVCEKCTNEPERNQLITNPIKESSLGHTPKIQSEGDSETESSDSSDCSETDGKPDPSKLQTVTYTTVQFNNTKKVPDYENIVETPDYVNVDLNGPNGKNKKLKKKVPSVDYTTVVPISVQFRRPSHPPATVTDSSSS